MTSILVNLYSRSSVKTLSLSEAKMKLSALIDEVSGTDEEVVITKNGVPAAGRCRSNKFMGALNAL
jgi:sulfur carrier protein ThiS